MQKFVRFAKNVWNISSTGKTDEEVALEGIEKLAEFIKELGIPTTLRELGATQEMLPLIAKSAIKGGGYKKMEENDILAVLKECY